MRRRELDDASVNSEPPRCIGEFSLVGLLRDGRLTQNGNEKEKKGDPRSSHFQFLDDRQSFHRYLKFLRNVGRISGWASSLSWRKRQAGSLSHNQSPPRILPTVLSTLGVKESTRNGGCGWGHRDDYFRPFASRDSSNRVFYTDEKDPNTLGKVRLLISKPHQAKPTCSDELRLASSSRSCFVSTLCVTQPILRLSSLNVTVHHSRCRRGG